MTTYGDEISGFEKNENVEEIFSSSSESIYKVIKPFKVDDNYELEEGWYIYECDSFNRAYTCKEELALCEMADVSLEGVSVAYDYGKDLSEKIIERIRDISGVISNDSGSGSIGSDFIDHHTLECLFRSGWFYDAEKTDKDADLLNETCKDLNIEDNSPNQYEVTENNYTKIFWI